MYNRLVHKGYSHMQGGEVHYIYGSSGYDMGRIVGIDDGCGRYECTYDAMGNVAEERRTVTVPYNGESYSFAMQYRHDSWGRMLSVVYPDSEAVNYSYQWGGELHSMQGTKAGVTRQYIKEIKYDSLGRRSSIRYGNNTHTLYGYDPLHRLAALSTYDTAGAALQSLAYSYDNNGNILNAANNSGDVDGMGGYYSNTHIYDNLNRLSESWGGGGVGCYHMQWNHTTSGRLVSRHRFSDTPERHVEAALDYGYIDYQQPHAVRRILDSCNRVHSDHLGSASWITDGGGTAIQHLQYLPYGEDFVNQRRAGYNERFTFTGKEKDAETGYGYFGARYMDHELMTMWLSVDPMSDKYPSISPTPTAPGAL